MLDRDLLRQSIYQKRQHLSTKEQQDYSDQITATCLQAPFFIQSKNVACYLAVCAEVSCEKMIQAIFEQHRSCYLPVVHPSKAGKMGFIHYNLAQTLEKNRYGILEPPFSSEREKPPEALDVIFLPVLGFNRQGVRLGSGGGYYDRALASLPEKRPVLVGLAYSCQEISALTKQPWDVKLDVIVTEEGLIFPD